MLGIAEIRVINGRHYHQVRPDLINLPEGYLFFAHPYEPEYKGAIYYGNFFVSLTKSGSTCEEIREITRLHQKSLKR